MMLFLKSAAFFLGFVIVGIIIFKAFAYVGLPGVGAVVSLIPMAGATMTVLIVVITLDKPDCAS